jgi:AbrB family looped-hinge helix DNA binding protein
MNVLLSNYHTMKDAMALTRMKEKGQVTIPAAVRGLIDAHKGDVFEVMVSEGNIVLRPQEVISRRQPGTTAKPAGVDITAWIGSGKGLFKTPDDADAFIRSERAQWE